MEFLILLVVVAVVWFWIKAKSNQAGITSKSQPPEIRFTVTTSTSSSFSRSSNNEPPDVGDLVEAGPNAWMLNPKSPLPLTLYNTNRELARQLKEFLGTAEYWTQKIPEIALLIAQHNLRFKEVDTFIADHKVRYMAEIERLISSSAEWAEASEKDRQDLRAEFESKAIESLAVSVGRADLACLLEGEPANFTEDDELVRKFGTDSSLYPFYLSALGRTAQVVTVKAEDYNRKHWEQLVEKGFARRGKDIPTQLLLEGLRLKEINELLAGTIEKPIGRKAKAIEAALKLPDLGSRLSERISYREMFQVLPPAGVDTEELGRLFAYATALATIVQQTYYTGVRTLGAIAERKRESGIFDAWEITNWGDPIPPCATPFCKKYDRLPTKRPPFHVGCDCQLGNTFKD
jgi:hypothetical protein